MALFRVPLVRRASAEVFLWLEKLIRSYGAVADYGVAFDEWGERR